MPSSAASSPAISRKVVDFPQPDGPSSTTRVPTSAVKLTLSTAGSAPQRFVTRSSRTCATRDPLRSCGAIGAGGEADGNGAA